MKLTQPPAQLVAALATLVAILATATAGYLFAQNQELAKLATQPPTLIYKPAVPIKSETSNQSPEVALGDFSGWQTYRNEEYGFEFKYPSGWNFEIQESFKDKGFFVTKDKNIFDILPAGGFGHGLPFEEPKVTNIEVSGREAKVDFYDREGNDIDYSIIYIKSNLPSKWTGDNIIEMLGDHSILNKMLASLKFIQ